MSELPDYQLGYVDGMTQGERAAGNARRISGVDVMSSTQHCPKCERLTRERDEALRDLATGNVGFGALGDTMRRARDAEADRAYGRENEDRMAAEITRLRAERDEWEARNTAACDEAVRLVVKLGDTGAERDALQRQVEAMQAIVDDYLRQARNHERRSGIPGAFNNMAEQTMIEIARTYRAQQEAEQ